MSVIVKEVLKGSPAFKVGIKSGDTLVSINGNDIMDVLDYRFYQNGNKLKITFINAKGKIKCRRIKKDESEELGMQFDTYLMDKQHSCLNKCVFCFIDQLPKGMRESLYFKDDDSRLSFLFGNYITLTNLTEHEIERIIKLHISPVNISVHTTNPELRVKMMKNKNAGKVLELIDRFNDAGIAMNCQLVVCPGFNDKDELERSLTDLTAKQSVKCIAVVPVGITGHREGLEKLTPFNKQTAGETIDLIDKFGLECLEKYNERRVFAADEFYLIAEREMPEASFYEDFLQLENGVGLSALLKSEVYETLEYISEQTVSRNVSIATGEAAYPLIKELAGAVCQKFKGIECEVFAIKNEFFGGEINVSGLVTGGDIIKQLKNKLTSSHLLIPDSMLRYENDRFLDDVTLEQLSSELQCEVIVVENNGQSFVSAVSGIEIGG